ncbi:MAG: peptide chain release factor N(5)-glutamine methyltransferase [Candidatus Omnitrophota bacterium]
MAEIDTVTEYSDTVPVQYQRGKADFLGMEVVVDPRVLIPRPETEFLVNVVRDTLRERRRERPVILDLGTGSGVIALALARSIGDCEVIGADLSRDALCVARENLRIHGRDGRVRFMVSDMFSGFGPGFEGRFDCIVSNPPYVSEDDHGKLDAWVKAEPRIALAAGREGMDCLDIIAGESGRFLSPEGFVALEVGYDQAGKVKSKLRSCGFGRIESFRDLNGFERIIIGWKHG